jgi:hypothetical protein
LTRRSSACRFRVDFALVLREAGDIDNVRELPFRTKLLRGRTDGARARIAKDYKVNSVVAEPNFGNGLFNKLLKPVLKKLGCPVEVVDAKRSPAQKEKRIIECLEPVLIQDKLVVNNALVLIDRKSTENLPAEEVNRYRLFDQLPCITKDKGALVNEGRIDAVALGVHYGTEELRGPPPS